MGTTKGFIRGLAVGVVLGAVAELVHSMPGKDEKAAALRKVAQKIRRHVAEHAKKLGKLSQAAYGSIVHTTVAEYRGMKTLSENELSQVEGELNESWEQVRKVVKGKKRSAGSNKK